LFAAYSWPLEAPYDQAIKAAAKSEEDLTDA
jgi:hypothetical protein